MRRQLTLRAGNGESEEMGTTVDERPQSGHKRLLRDRARVWLGDEENPISL